MSIWLYELISSMLFVCQVLARRKVIQQHHTTPYFISLTVAQCVLLLMTLTREYKHVDWFCKLGNLVRDCFFQAHGQLVAALVVDRCVEMTSRHVTSIVASTGRYELPLCCSRWSSAVVSGIGLPKGGATNFKLGAIHGKVGGQYRKNTNI